MKIVIEGYDSTGKSTLAKALAERLGLEVLEAGPKPESEAAAIADALYQLNAKGVINCRITPLSNLAYQTNISPGTRLQLWRVVSDYIRCGTIFIHCTSESGAHDIKDYDTTEHLDYIEKNKDAIRVRYEALFSLIPHFTYDMNTDSMEDMVCKIVSHF
jgi:thymidylate kinase